MIWHPKPSQRVTLRYRKSMRDECPHLCHGIVLACGRGPGPRNAIVLLDDERIMSVPRGNLFAKKEN